MSSLARIYGLLAPLGLYRLGQGGLIDAELTAYGAGFSLLEEELGGLLRDVDPATASEEALGLYERALGLPDRTGASVQSRRELICLRGQRARTCAKSELVRLLWGCGFLSPGIEEKGRTVRIVAEGIAEGMDADTAFSLALRLLPAHVGVGAGYTWDMLAADMPTWNALAALGRSWSALALLGVGV